MVCMEYNVFLNRPRNSYMIFLINTNHLFGKYYNQFSYDPLFFQFKMNI